ncbi:MAG: alpha/beta fold hydrolase [Ilumatobacteraceae bacterium]
MSDWRRLSGPLNAFTLGSGERVVFCHGFTQTSTSWKPIAALFAAGGFEAVVVDLPGHGGSAHVRADLRRTADLLTAMTGPASFVGYSMGGRLCLQTALIYPSLVRRLAMIGASPGIDDDEQRAGRRNRDNELADHIGEVGVDVFLDEWTAQPLFGGVALDPSDIADRRRNTADGLATSLRLAGTGAQVSLWNRLYELAMPVLVMAGELDTKFVDIGHQMARAVADGNYQSITGAAHSAHLQQPAAVVALLAQWLGTRLDGNQTVTFTDRGRAPQQ